MKKIVLELKSGLIILDGAVLKIEEEEEDNELIIESEVLLYGIYMMPDNNQVIVGVTGWTSDWSPAKMKISGKINAEAFTLTAKGKGISISSL
jgi:hypothetical protein